MEGAPGFGIHDGSGVISWVVPPSQDATAANEGLVVGIPEPKNGSCQPGGDEPASWEGGEVTQVTRLNRDLG